MNKYTQYTHVAVCINPFAQGDALHRGLGHPSAQGWADVSGGVLGTWQLHKARRARNTTLCAFSARPCAPRVSVKRRLRSINFKQNLRKAYRKHNTNKTSKPSIHTCIWQFTTRPFELNPTLEETLLFSSDAVFLKSITLWAQNSASLSNITIFCPDSCV